MAVKRVESRFRDFLFSKLNEDWLRVSVGARPKTIWVAEHEPTHDPDSHIVTPVVGAWHFDGNGFHEKPVSDIVVFLNLSVGYTPAVGGFEIGIAGFAPIVDSLDAALFWQFSGLSGIGYRCVRESDSCLCKEVWRS